jgi:hypothetical protein
MTTEPDPDTLTGLTPLKAIRAKCLDCCCFSAHEVKLCPVVKCPLHHLRLGIRPSTIAKRLADKESATPRKKGTQPLHLRRKPPQTPNIES